MPAFVPKMPTPASAARAVVIVVVVVFGGERDGEREGGECERRWRRGRKKEGGKGGEKLSLVLSDPPSASLWRVRRRGDGHDGTRIAVLPCPARHLHRERGRGCVIGDGRRGKGARERHGPPLSPPSCARARRRCVLCPSSSPDTMRRPREARAGATATARRPPTARPRCIAAVLGGWAAGRGDVCGGLVFLRGLAVLWARCARMRQVRCGKVGVGKGQSIRE
jgi:hypothetical protein